MHVYILELPGGLWNQADGPHLRDSSLVDRKVKLDNATKFPDVPAGLVAVHWEVMLLAEPLYKGNERTCDIETQSL